MEKISVNSNLCDGCLNCEKMCASVHKVARIKIIEHDSSYYSIVCQHCDNAPCIKVCPTDAMSREGVDEDKCIGCGLCSIICPFGAITLNGSIAEKCNLCQDREEGPACIKSCSKRAISLVDPAKVKLKNQEKYIAKLSGETKVRNINGGFVRFITSQARARLVLEE